MSRAVFVLIFAIVFNAFANILIKVGMVRIRDTSGLFRLIQEAVKQPALIGGVCCFILALAAYSMVLTRLNLSIAYPVMVSMGLVIVTLASFFLLKETIKPLQIAGFVFIIAGVWMVAR
jgi:multidrug transporter EmrE-like cation transporter